jgi:hypothetical protein
MPTESKTCKIKENLGIIDRVKPAIRKLFYSGSLVYLKEQFVVG